jgi:hypothetical protein
MMVWQSSYKRLESINKNPHNEFSRRFVEAENNAPPVSDFARRDTATKQFLT